MIPIQALTVILVLIRVINHLFDNKNHIETLFCHVELLLTSECTPHSDLDELNKTSHSFLYSLKPVAHTTTHSIHHYQHLSGIRWRKEDDTMSPVPLQASRVVIPIVHHTLIPYIL